MLTPIYKDNNGWALQVDVDLKDLTDDQYNEITKLVTTDMVLVFKKQYLTADDEVDVARKIGIPHPVYNTSKPLKGQAVENIVENEYITRVTAKKDDNGFLSGIAGQSETIEWHTDRAFNTIVPGMYWLYAVTGSKGSCTSFLNLAKAYEDLDENIKKRIENKKVICGIKEPMAVPPCQAGEVPRYWVQPIMVEIDLVRTTVEGKTGLYFPFNQLHGMADTSQEEFEELSNILKQHVLQEKYMYYHYWEDGDVLLADQRLTIHKRWSFQKMDERLVHRMSIWTREQEKCQHVIL
jgi:taurine dioxygenase